MFVRILKDRLKEFPSIKREVTEDSLKLIFSYYFDLKICLPPSKPDEKTPIYHLKSLLEPTAYATLTFSTAKAYKDLTIDFTKRPVFSIKSWVFDDNQLKAMESIVNKIIDGVINNKHEIVIDGSSNLSSLILTESGNYFLLSDASEQNTAQVVSQILQFVSCINSFFSNEKFVFETVGAVDGLLTVSEKVFEIYKSFASVPNPVCNVCFEEKDPSLFILLSCGHSYCRDCIKELLEFHIKEGSVEELKCPFCSVEIDKSVVLNICPDLFTRYERLKTTNYLNNQSEYSYSFCPNCNGDYFCDKDATCGTCPHCNFSFCPKCKKESHTGECGQHASLMQRKRENESSNQWIVSNTTPCPKCHVRVFKNEGCNHVICSICKSEFCYRCGKLIKGYDHFKNCVLFPNVYPYVDFPQPEQRFVARQQNSVTLAQSRLGTCRKCPVCGMPNLKTGSSNVIFCTNCASMFCFLCGHNFSSLDHFYKPNVIGEMCLSNSPIANLEDIHKPTHENFVYFYKDHEYTIKLSTKKALVSIGIEPNEK